MLRDAVSRYQAHLNYMHDRICASFLANADSADKLAHDTSIWPRISPTSLLQHLSGSHRISSEWKNILIQYGIVITQIQQYQRALSMLENRSDLLRELSNRGHIGWQAEEHPEWLLFELENNLLIRPNQAQIAKEMLSPSSGGNCCMLLNMGEGKSSVIVPIVAATLADGRHLPRVIVLPALAAQMFHILRQKLGGMLNRRVVTMPFSRSTSLTCGQAGTIQTIYEQCLRDKCVVLCQPEHILSFDLMAIEQTIKDEQRVRKGMSPIPQHLDGW